MCVGACTMYVIHVIYFSLKDPLKSYGSDTFKHSTEDEKN